MAYLARRSASREQLRRYLLRTLERRTEPQERAGLRATVDAVMLRLEGLALLDDTGLARSRAQTLVRKGLPSRRVRVHLAGQGFDLADPALDGLTEVDDEAQARRYAERKRLGPFGSGLRQPSFERDVRALVRAGFDAKVATRLMTSLYESGPEQPEADALPS